MHTVDQKKGKGEKKKAAKPVPRSGYQLIIYWEVIALTIFKILVNVTKIEDMGTLRITIKYVYLLPPKKEERKKKKSTFTDTNYDFYASLSGLDKKPNNW